MRVSVVAFDLQRWRPDKIPVGKSCGDGLFILNVERVLDLVIASACGVHYRFCPGEIAALAIEWGCEWVTMDRDFARFPGLKWSVPKLAG